MMPSGPIIEAGARPDRTFSTFSGEDTRLWRHGVCRVRWVTEQDQLVTPDLEAKTEFRHSALSQAESAVTVKRERWDGDHQKYT